MFRGEYASILFRSDSNDFPLVAYMPDTSSLGGLYRFTGNRKTMFGNAVKLFFIYAP